MLSGDKEAISTLGALVIHLCLASLCFSPAEQVSITKETRSVFSCHSELSVATSKDGSCCFWKRKGGGRGGGLRKERKEERMI